MSKRKDVLAGLEQAADAAGELGKAPKRGLKSLRPQQEKRPPSEALAFRIPADLADRLHEAEARHGIERHNRAAFLARLLERGLDDLDAGRLVIGRRDAPDL